MRSSSILCAFSQLLSRSTTSLCYGLKRPLDKKLPLDRALAIKGELAYRSEPLLIELYEGGEAGVFARQKERYDSLTRSRASPSL